MFYMKQTKMKIVFLIAVYIIQPIVSEVYSETAQLAMLGQCPECTVREIKNISLSPICLSCFCDLECLKYGDCCIDILIQNNLHTKQIDHGLTCIVPPIHEFRQFQTTKDPVHINSNGFDSTFLIGDGDTSNKKPYENSNDYDTDYSDDDLKRYLGYYIRTHYTDVNQDVMCDKVFIPVTCNNGITYINIICAVLNKAGDCVSWTFEMDSKNPSNTHPEYYFLPPASAEVRLCDHHRSNEVISTCAPKYSTLSSLCSKYYSLVVDGVDGKVYRNMFCYECNGGEMKAFTKRRLNPLISLTTFTHDIKEITISCNGMTSWFDSNARKCRPIKCQSERILKDGLCLSNNRTALGTKYYALIQLNLDTTRDIPVINQIIGHMMFEMQAELSSTSFQIEASDQIHDSDGSIVLLLHVWFKVTEDIMLMDVENSLMHACLTKSRAFFGFNVISRVIAITQPEHQIARYFKSNSNLRLCCMIEDGSNIPYKSDFEPVTTELTCAYVEFEQSEYKLIYINNYNTKPDYKLLQDAAFIGHFNLTLVRGEFSIVKNKLSICFDYLLTRTNTVRTNETFYISDDSSSFDVILWYVTIACISLSMLSLFIIIITYTFFKELQTQPGINNMILSWNLFLAQLILMVGFDEIKQVTLCKTLGVVTHFFWLSTLFWMNICSFHMFKVFVLGKLLISASHATVKQSMIYCIYGYGCAALIISSTIIANVIPSNGNQLGYGGDICYLSSTVLVLYSFVIPLCFVIISNVIFFIWTVVTIQRVKQEGKQTGERNNIYIYLKLSVVTGVFWTVSLLSNFLDTVVLDYISVILNGSQGVFLVWSLIINKKVLRKYRAVFCKCIPNVHSETSNARK